MILMICIFLPAVNVMGDGAGDYPAPGTGDWIIRNQTYVSHETIVLEGELRVLDNATLILDNVTILFNSTTNGPKGILVERGSSLNILNSNITDLIGFFNFDVLGNMTLENSFISRVTGGIFIEYGDVRINNCQIYNNLDFAIAGFGDPVITNNTIFSSHGGILTGFGSAPFIYNNTIISNDWGIICNSYGFADIIGNNISGNSLGGINVKLGHFDIHNNTISSNGGFGIRSDHAIINATNNLIYDNERWGIYSLDAPIISENNYFERNGRYNKEGDILQEWEVLIQVFDTLNNSLDNVNISVFDQHEDLMWSGNTIGNVRIIVLREYESRDNGTLLTHTPFTINAKIGIYSNSTTLDITDSEMSIFESNTLNIIVDIEEEEGQVEEYEFPFWGLIVVVGIWVFVLIMIVIGIVYSLSMKKKRAH